MTTPSRCLLLAAVLLASGVPAHAAATPRPGLALYQDGALELRLGGTVHLDGSWLEQDEDATFGSTGFDGDSETGFGRAYLTLLGRFGGWRLRAEPDFVAPDATSRSNIAVRDFYVAAPIAGGELQLGQRRPLHGMETLTGDNDILMIARPFASDDGVFAGGRSRRFAPGAYYLGSHDAFAWGIGAYGLRALGRHGVEGLGASARAVYAPLAAAAEVVHLGAWVAWEDPGDDSATAAPGSIGTAAAYAGERGPRAAVGLSGAGEAALTVGFEYANAFGPFFAQAEFMLQTLSQAGGAKDQDVFAYYAQGSYAISGEPRPYDLASGTFRALRPRRAAGAWEITARYDGASNRDVAAVGGGCGSGAAVDRCNVWAITAGLNYYLNPHARLMLNYGVGEQDRGSFGHDRPRALAVRIQLSY